jgi:hypothetical protein
MRTIRVLTLLGAVLALAAVTASGQDWLKGNADEKLKTLGDIQPGLGTVMIEYANRFTTAYYAAKDGNWDLAAYMVKEMREIQEVGETTRPARAGALKAFEKSYLDTLDAAIKAKDFKKFATGFKGTVEGCNGCHAGQGFPYIKYQLPKTPPSPLVMKP